MTEIFSQIRSFLPFVSGMVSVRRIQSMLLRAELRDPTDEDEVNAKPQHAQVS
jgi:hypothetical protein